MARLAQIGSVVRRLPGGLVVELGLDGTRVNATATVDIPLGSTVTVEPVGGGRWAVTSFTAPTGR